MNRLLVPLLAGLVLLAGLAIVIAALYGMAASRYDVTGLARAVPVSTAMMRQRADEARRDGHRYAIDQRWVPYGRISPLLRRAVLIAEDDAFFSHDGLDWNEMRAALRRNVRAGRIVRGGSTITQQLARNLYLGNARTLTRKLEEIAIARRLEGALNKRRIFELYLNLIEWGDGIFGIEAAARRHFGVAAASLDPRQAALLAAVIINPRRWDPAHPSRRIESRARMILGRMAARGFITHDEFLAATGGARLHHGLFDWLFGGGGSPSAPADTGVTAPTAGDSSAALPDSLP
ncbi:MAG: monofunctional biosynthetic peptidoglycan transglycosylase [Candidatus Eisenbacteria bacterium]|uniref:Biosynthetic peptidoglycan transglycosylase n=1 Tax=Eiseniibacteriota bacterium TaxID=2212470 RepID=A0A9D6L7Z8_UNCEI|nr:monofunctional biosynthetic peptidoglycan transglycosylase [Candidatus Eisenbacteria bacterium]MBI3539539.1 monofunctional biosynthetic peptidoglycan transglycosylase [Candidatus Eisenbacteria bacterium]